MTIISKMTEWEYIPKFADNKSLEANDQIKIKLKPLSAVEFITVITGNIDTGRIDHALVIKTCVVSISGLTVIDKNDPELSKEIQTPEELLSYAGLAGLVDEIATEAITEPEKKT